MSEIKYLLIDEHGTGPLTLEEIRALSASGRIESRWFLMPGMGDQAVPMVAIIRLAEVREEKGIIQPFFGVETMRAEMIALDRQSRPSLRAAPPIQPQARNLGHGEEPLMMVGQVAAFLQVDLSTVSRWMRQGILLYYMIGKKSARFKSPTPWPGWTTSAE